jgi:hypothetical protein
VLKLCKPINKASTVSVERCLQAGMPRATSAAPEVRVEETDIICERLVATAIEATMIVVESKLHGDPIPGLRAHYQVILEEREKLYRRYQHVSRSNADALLREHGLRALSREYRADTRNGHEELRGTFIQMLFYRPELDPLAHALDAELKDIRAVF